MQVKRIHVNELLINPANDRHGELADESRAIEWLLTHRATHMRNLTKDIVKEQDIYEPPLVHDDNGKYIVFDGNRRVTALKLLHAPQKAPSKDWADFFAAQRQNWNGKLLEKLTCQVETDRDRIDEILYRRHTGGQSGIGQSQWDPSAKSNFVARTGKKSKVNLAEEIEKKLKQSGRLDDSVSIPRSNMNRLLSAEAFRNRVGLSIVKNHVEFTHKKEKVLDALANIANDLISKKIVLEDIWNNKGKRKYLNELESKGTLPSIEDVLDEKEEVRTKQDSITSTEPQKKSPTPAELPRRNLIRHEDYGLVRQAHLERVFDIWNELQNHLRFGEHDNAISVLFRVLLEFSLENYISKKNLLTVHPNDKLSKKFRKVLDDMSTKRVLDKKYLDNLKKFEQQEALFSANTMHTYVHHKDFFPSDHHLKAMWDNLSNFVVACLRD